MLVPLAVWVTAAPFFAPAYPWAVEFAAPPRIPLVGDVNHDGCADLVAVYPTGDCIIDVNLTVEGGAKSGGGFQALTHWGKNCQAATIGEIDDVPGADVVGLFDGKTLRLAADFADGHFKDVPNWATLPKPLEAPALACLNGGHVILAFSTHNGDAYEIDSKTRAVTPCHVPGGTTWIGDAGARFVGQSARGEVFWIEPKTLRRQGKLGDAPKNSRPAAGVGVVAFGNKAWTPDGIADIAPPKEPAVDTVRGIGDIDADGDLDIVEFRNGSEHSTGHQILLRRRISAGEIDSDHDGLTNEEEIRLGSDPYNPSTANDGLLDGWKVRGFRGLDLAAMGCSPTHADVLCLVSRFSEVKDDHLKSEMTRVIKFYDDLDCPNPDGKKGIHFHPIYLDPIAGVDEKNSWQTNRDKFRPEKWRGVVHWMQVTPGGGGQADELSDGGTCGQNALWAVFVHEFGHQLGMNHEGFWPNGSCPIYTSLMNYCYSYSFNDDRNQIHYSDGALAGLVLRETDLDETLPFPYEKVKFLEKGPYHFHLKPNGRTTLIDWNWDGIFGEKHVRADINYAYSTNAGERDRVGGNGKTMTAPWLVVHRNRAFLLYGTHDFPVDLRVDPTVGPDRPGTLWLRRLVKPTVWDKPWSLTRGDLTGDPVAASWDGKLAIIYQTAKGVMLQRVDLDEGDLVQSALEVIDPDGSLVPTVGSCNGRLYLFLWNSKTGAVTYRSMSEHGGFGVPQTLDATSVDPVGLCEDPRTHEAVIGLAQDQDPKKTFRWQVRRYHTEGERLVPTTMEWVEGKDGGARGTGRITVLFDTSRDAGPHGRIYFFAKGLTGKENPWACTYVAQQVEDKTVHGGWIVKREYDEWTQSRSAPAAAWFEGDIIWSYRWVDGGQSADGDNQLQVGYHGLGIQSEPFGDFDDITFIRSFGLENSLLSLGKG
jgi:hypothetical protein